jgi:hypothetical protein
MILDPSYGIKLTGGVFEWEEAYVAATYETSIWDSSVYYVNKRTAGEHLLTW